MKISELIRENTENLINALKEADDAAYRNTACEYRVYIDSNGECGYEEWLAGDLGWYEFRDPDYRRYYIHTFCHQYDDFDRDWYVAGKENDWESFIKKVIDEAISDGEANGFYEEIVERAIYEYAI